MFVRWDCVCFVSACVCLFTFALGVVQDKLLQWIAISFVIIGWGCLFVRVCLLLFFVLYKFQKAKLFNE